MKVAKLGLIFLGVVGLSSCASQQNTLAISDPTSFIFTSRPSADQYALEYPTIGEKSGHGGKLTSSCRATKEGDLEDCYIVEEDPLGEGFGRASLNLIKYFHAGPKLAGGISSIGARSEIKTSWNISR